MQALTAFQLKCRTIEQLDRNIPHSRLRWVSISNVIVLTPPEFEYFSMNLLQDYPFLQGQGVVLVRTPSDDIEDILVVDTQGYSYARYAGLPFGIK